MSNLLITGGTGTIGQAIVDKLYKTWEGKIIIYSRDESKHAAMMEKYPEGGESGLRYLIGDICDYERLRYAMKDVNIVIHAAAMKHIDKCEYNPFESMRVNVEGSINVAKACIGRGVQCCTFVSTDKACNPVSAYGAQKYSSERMFIGCNNMGGTRFNVVRYGNVWGSRGSFLAKWEKIKEHKGTISLTDPEMTRFFWDIGEAADFVIDHMISLDRGCVYIPKLGSKSMMDIAMQYSHNIEITGMRCPEKIHEELISAPESLFTYDQGTHYTIYPGQHDWSKKVGCVGVKVHDGFRYSSGGLIPKQWMI